MSQKNKLVLGACVLGLVILLIVWFTLDEEGAAQPTPTAILPAADPDSSQNGAAAVTRGEAGQLDLTEPPRTEPDEDQEEQVKDDTRRVRRPPRKRRQKKEVPDDSQLIPEEKDRPPPRPM